MRGKPDRWNICDDFLEPLAELLYGRPLGWEDAIGGAGHAHELRAWVDRSDMRFALVWLQVNVSCDVADRVEAKIEQALTDATNGKWMDEAETSVYLQDLALVLRGQLSGSIPTSAIPDEPLTPPLAKVRLGKIFGCDPRSVQSMVLDMMEHKVVGKGSQKRYRLRVKDMPPDWETFVTDKK